LATRADRDAVNVPVHFVAVHVDDHLECAALIEFVHVAGVVLLVVAVAGVEADHRVVNLVQRTVGVG